MIISGCYSILVYLNDSVPNCFTIEDKCYFLKRHAHDGRCSDVLLNVRKDDDLWKFFKLIDPYPVHVHELRYLGEILFTSSMRPFEFPVLEE